MDPPENIKCARKIFLANLATQVTDKEGCVWIPHVGKCSKVWAQGYIVQKEHELVCIDDGTSVCWFDTTTYKGKVELNVGMYVSCVADLRPIQVSPGDQSIEVLLEFVTDLSAASLAMCEPAWFLEVCAATKRSEEVLRKASTNDENRNDK